MPNLPTISDAEWEVMNVLWAAGPGESMAANDVVAAALAGGRKEWSPRTVKTLLNRLLKKGALSAEAQGKRYLYRAAVRREQCVRAESRSFLQRVFAGAAGPMLVQFVSQAELTEAEIEELQRVLAIKGARGRKGRRS